MLGLKSKQRPGFNEMIQFTLTLRLDSSMLLEFAFILHFDGRDRATMEVFKINYVFSYGDTDSMVISHTGLEDVSLVDSSEINSGFTL
jgi:hypothetical protein